MASERIPNSRWGEFCDRFSRQHEGWLVTLEVAEARSGPRPGGHRRRTVAHDMPLRGVTFDPREGLEDEVSVILGEGPREHYTHIIHAPRRISFARTRAGADEALEIDSDASGLTRVKFRTPSPPEVVDGTAWRRGEA